MLLNFPICHKTFDTLDNHELFLMPNGIYRARHIQPDNFLYPMYYLKEGNEYLVSTSVYALIQYKKSFVRNPKFQNVNWFIPTFLTIDRDIQRARTTFRRSTCELTEKKDILDLGVRLFQEYITEIEEKYPGWVHILLMGGMDSENIILANRKERWIVVSGEPNARLNEKFIDDNDIKIDRFVSVPNDADNTFLLEEILASDCSYSVRHIHYSRTLNDLVKEAEGKAVIWMGTSGDGTFARNNNHRDSDYYAVHDLHVGTAMGVLHQTLKNFLNVPVLSPYQSPSFLDKLFYRFDPYYVDQSGDVREEMGAMLYGRSVKYPQENPRPVLLERNHSQSIPSYVSQLIKDGVPCELKAIESWIRRKRAAAWLMFNSHSSRRRTKLSKILFPFRRELGKVFPGLRNNRHDISRTEIK